MELEPPIEFRIRPGVLGFRLPRHHLGLSPAAARRRLGRFGLERLVRMAAGTGPAA